MILSWCVNGLSFLIAWISFRLFLVTFVLSIAYATGLLHRLLLFIAEREATTLCNGTQVTIGCFTYTDFIHGKFAASNVVIHAPQPHAQWQSPLVARIGHVTIEMNAWHFVSCWIWYFGEHTPLDMYAIHMTDVQFFVERNPQGLYNFLFLDPHVVLPATTEDTTTKTTSKTVANNENTTTSSSSTVTLDATAIVEDMLEAVRRAAKDGRPDTLVAHYRRHLSRHLRDWRTTAHSLQQGVQLLEDITSCVHSKTARVFPTRRKPNDTLVYGRVGKLRVQELRIFLPDDHLLHVPEFVLKPTELAVHSVVFPLLDDVFDVVLKRLLAEIAKSNTGQFFQTAMQEMAETLSERK